MSLYLVTWCPNQQPPAKCDPCGKCTWVSADFNITGTQPNITVIYDIPRSSIYSCHPKFAVELWQDQTSIGGVSQFWLNGLVFPVNATNGASATLTYSYGGVPVLILTGTVLVVSSGNTSDVPAQFRGTAFYQGVYSSTGQFIENILYYTSWAGAPDNYVETPSFPTYGFLYDGPLTSDDPQLVTLTVSAAGAKNVVVPFFKFYSTG